MASDSAPETAFEEVVQAATAKGSDVVPGCVLSAVNSKGTLFYDKAFGYAGSAPDAKPLDKNAVYWIASCTKLLTSISALQCVENGKVDLDEDVTRHLPELGKLPIITKDESAPDGYTLKERTKTITLRHLLSHSSGVGYEFMTPLISVWRKKHGPPAEELKGKVLLAHSIPLFFEPGESWVYGGGLDWAGILVERLSGLTLGDYFAKNIFAPLGIDSTTFHIDQRPDLLERLMPPSRRDPATGALVPADSIGFSKQTQEHSGGGGLWGSVPDYTKVLADLIAPEPKLLKAETVDDVLAAPQLPAGSPAQLALATRGMSSVAANAAALGGKIPPVSYGCGGLVTTADTDIFPAGTLSWGGLPNLKWFVHRKLGVGAMFATQLLPSGDAKSNALANAYFKEVLRLHAEGAGQ